MAAEERRAWPAVPTAVLCGKVDELVSAPSAGELAIEAKEEELDGLDVKAMMELVDTM
jgi:hypothetical protein